MPVLRFRDFHASLAFAGHDLASFAAAAAMPAGQVDWLAHGHPVDLDAATARRVLRCLGLSARDASEAAEGPPVDEDPANDVAAPRDGSRAA